MARRRQGSSSTGKILGYLIIAVGVGYVLFTLAGNLFSKTAVIESGNLGKQFIADVVIVRDETLIDAEGISSVRYYADEGEQVATGSKIAEVYSTGYSQTDINKLLNVRADIKRQVKSALASGYADEQLNRLDSMVLDYARELGMLVQGKESGNLLNLERQLTNSLENRQNYLRDKFYASQPTLSGLYDTETTLVKKIQSWTTTHRAARDCIVSFYTDGWETVLTVDKFDEIALADVKTALTGGTPPLTTAQRGRTSVFREVSPYGWYMLLVSNDKNWNPVNGQSYKVQLKGFEDLVIDGVVSSFTRNGNDLLVRMSVNAETRPVLNTRTAKAEVGEQYVSGLKVPLNAVLQQNGQTGVVLTDRGGVFVPVHVIMQDNTYAVVTPITAGALSEGQKIRVF